MIIKSTTGVANFSIELKTINCSPGQHPTLAFNFSAENQDYFGRIHDAWFHKADLQAFILELEQLFSQQKSVIQFKAFSEFWLRIEQINSTGQLNFRAHIESFATNSILEIEIDSDLSIIDSMKSYFLEIISQTESKL